MKHFNFTQRTFSLAAAALLSTALTAVAYEQPSVVDPSTGETVAISQVDMGNLGKDQHHDIADQMAQMGMPADRPGRFGQDNTDDQGRNGNGYGTGDDGRNGQDRGGQSDDGDGGEGHEGEGHGGEGHGGEGHGGEGHGGEGHGGEGHGGDRD